MPDDLQRQSIFENRLNAENINHISMIVNKKIVLTTLICYSIDRFGFGAPDFSFWEKNHKFRRKGESCWPKFSAVRFLV
jgi:hypothetical protein